MKIEDLHKPVLLEKVLEWIKVGEKGVVVDGTLGMGGHSEEILKRFPQIKLIAFEWNRESYELAKERLKKFGDRVKIYQENFVRIREILEKEGVKADSVLLDLGISSFLLEHSGKGFSFQSPEEPLDMRMDERAEIQARDILNIWDYETLSELFSSLEVPRSKILAKEIVDFRKKRKFEKVSDLLEVIKKVFPRLYGKKEKKIIALVFQALRIEVNKELENLKKALSEIPDVLKPKGRFLVISFHSLEDRMVKNCFKKDKRLRVLTKKPVSPEKEEILQNPRARSAKLRVAERVDSL